MKKHLNPTILNVLRLLLVFAMLFQLGGTALAYTWTDPTDYPPGSTVTIRGDNSDSDNAHNWSAGETVHVDVVGPKGYLLACDGVADDLGAWTCDVTLDPNPAIAVGEYTYTAKGVTSGNVEYGMFTDSQEDYKHWADKPPADWQNGAVQSSNSQYFEGEVVPHYWKSQGLTVNTTYAINIYYDYYDLNAGTCGFDYLAQYNTSRAPTFVDGTPAADDALPQGYGNFYTVGANITAVTAPMTVVNQRYVQVTFTATAAKAEFYWGLHLSLPGAIGTCDGAHDWSGASLQTHVEPTPSVSGATMLGGGGTLAINPSGVIAGAISGYKWSDLNGNSADNTEPRLSGWTIRLCSDSACTSVLQSTVTDASGNYTFRIPPGTYYVQEVLQGGWRQTAPTTVYYGPLVVNATTPTYSNQNFGNQQLGTVIVNKTATGGDATFGFTTTGGDGLPASFNVTTSGGSGSQTYPNIVPGTYSVAEDTIAGWTLTGSSCSSGTPASFTVAPGGTVTCSFTNLKQAPALTLTKNASPSTYDTVGQTISYVYVIRNTGNVTLNGPFSVTDDEATVACTQPTDSALSPNEEMNCTATHTVTQADLDASKITNKATATNGTVTSNEATATVYAVGHPNLSLVKTASPANYDHVGQTISYSYVVKNIGNVALMGPFAVTDDKITASNVVTCPQPASLAVGASITCSATYAITQADLDAGSVTNHASATATYGGNAVTSNPAQATVNASQARALAIDKTAAETVYAAVGNVIHYSYKVTNAGNVTLLDPITVNDNKAVATCPALPAGGLAPGAFITCSATYTITQADLDAGSLTNVASATSGTTTSPTDTVTIPATQSPALSLVKSASPATYNSAGQTINYSYDLKNTGNVTLSGPFTVTDDQVSVTCSNVTSLAVGDTLTCAATHTVTQAEVDFGSITNIAKGHAFHGTTPVDSNQDTKTVTAVKNPALTIVKAATPSTYKTLGETISYNYLVTNAGNVTLYNITVVDNKAIVTCPSTASGLAPAGTITCSASYTITQADLDSGSVTNSAYATDGATNSPPDSETVDAIQEGGLGLSKTATPPTYDEVGDVVSYSYVVENTGNITLAGPFTVNDDKVGVVNCPAGSLAPDATVTCLASYTITQADLDAGSLTNTATATDGTLTSNEASATVAAVQTPALAIDKTAAETVYDAVDDVIHYSYKVTNAGNVTLHDPIIVSDDKATDESCPALPAGGLAPGASITCTASYTIQQSDLDAGSLTNVASATDGKITSPTDTVTMPATQMPKLTLKKSANPLEYTTLGQTITYDYLLTNSGNVMLSGPFAVTDDKTTVTCPGTVTSLAPGETLNCTATYIITQADLDSGKLTNIATATAKFGDTTVTSNQDTATVSAVQNPELTLVKTASPSTYDAADQTISYSYLLTNSGNVTLSGPFTVTDDKATDEACPATPTSLAPGESVTCTASYTIAQADLDAGLVTNTATASANGTDSNPDDETVTAVQSPHITLVKDVTETSYDAAGDVLHYTLVAMNDGNVTLTNVSISDPLLGHLTCDVPQPTTLAPGDTLSCEGSYTVKQGDVNAGKVDNTASTTGTPPTGPAVTDTANASVPATQGPALTLVKTATPTTYSAVDQVISYSYLLTNSGNVTLSGPFTVTDDKATDEACPATPASLAPGESVTCTASYTIAQADLDAGSVTNLAAGHGFWGTTPIDSDTDTETVTATQTPKLTLVKTASPTTYDAVGDTISYSYLLTNSGNVTLSGPFTVTDDKATDEACPATPASLAPGESVTCTASYTIMQADLDAGSVTNVAAGHGFWGTTPIDSDTDTETVTATQTPKLAIVKTASPTTFDAVGDIINYSYLLTNSGNVTLSGPFTVTDDKATDEACPATPASLAPGESVTCTASYTIAQADLDSGSVTNVAAGHGFWGTIPVDSDTDTETVTATQSPALSLVKTATPTTYAAVDDVISYSYVVKNTGNVTLHDPVTVTDDKATVTCPPLPSAGLAPGAFITCAASYAISQADLDSGSVTNTAYAQSGDTTSNTDDETVTATQNPALSLVKTATPSTYSQVGDVIAYSYVIKNTGNVTLSGPFSVTDDKATVTCTQPDDAALSPDEAMTCSASYAITQTDLDAGLVLNTATATNGTVTSNEAIAIVTADKKPALSLVKTADPLTYSAKEQTITYSYVIRNTGNVTLDGPFSVTDDKATVTCTQPEDGKLSPDEVMTCTATYTITQTDLDNGQVINKATATNDTVISNEATATVTAVPTKSLSLVKTATPGTYDSVGDTIYYSYLVTNSGNVTLNGPFSVLDDKATVTCTQPEDGKLSPNEEMTCTASYTITQTDLDNGSVTNTATASGGDATSNEAQATVTAVQTRALAIDKSAQETTYAEAGDVIHYSYLVTNTGNVTLHDPITVSDDKATDESCPALPAGGLAPGESITCTASYAVTQADLDAGSLTNVASATDGTTTSPTDTVTVPATQRPALELTKSASPATYNRAGQTINYSYVLKNTGNVTLSGPFTVTDDKAAVTCPPDVTSLAVGDTLTCSASYTITQAEVDAGSITNIAKGHAFFGTTPVDSNEDTKTVTADKKPALTIVKTATPGTYDALGQAISYSYLVTNSGNITLYNISVVDDKAPVTCPSTAAGLAPAGTITCTASYSITQTDLDAGSVTNSAYATDGTTSSAPDSETVNALQQGGLGLTKSASPATYDAVGQKIIYSYVIKNTGNVTLAGPFFVSDDRIGSPLGTAFTCGSGPLAPNATTACSVEYVITQTDLDAGSITNHATATDGTLISNEAQATVTAVQTRALAIDKSAQETTYAKAGDVIHYSYLVTNAGNVTLHDPITVSDDKATDESCPALPAGGLAPGQSITCTASYAVTQADLDAGSLTNVASATDGTTTSPTDTVTVPATQRPALALTKSASPVTYNRAGQTINYSYVLKNTGNVTLSGPFTVTDDKAAVTCPAAVTSLAVGDTLTCSASYTITQADLDNGKVTNTATASGGGATSNQATATVTATLCKALSLTKTASPTTYSKAGDVITYRYVIRNVGNVTLTGPFSVTDNKTTVSCTQPADGALSPNETMICSASYTITAADMIAGKVTNKATASGGGVTSNLATATVNATLCKALSLTKTASPTTYSKTGDVISYSYVIRNVGNVTLTGPFSITDDKAMVTCTQPADSALSPNETMTCSASYTITAADMTAGKVTNKATASGGGATSNLATVTVTVTQCKALSLIKTASPTTYSKVGDVINYSYVIRNVGYVTLAGPFSVTDDKATVTCTQPADSALSPNETMTCSASYTITQTDLDNGSVTNTATASGGGVTSNTVTKTVYLGIPTALTLSDFQATALSTGESLMALLRSWLQR